MTHRFARFAALFAVYASLSAPAYAYLDPATGSIIVQAMIGAVAAWMLYTRAFFARVRAFFGRFGGGQPKNNDCE
jgi:hypothetical protein